MRFTVIAILFATSIAAHAHPGHPAASPQHSHAFFGIDPMYALMVIVAGVAGAVLIAARRQRARSKAQ